jgi:hypothetical protein
MESITSEIEIYKIKNKECYKKIQKQYCLNHKKELKEYRKQYHLDHKEQHMLEMYKMLDKKKNLICNLTEDWIKENITSKPCIYCGDVENIGCDRINHNKGHIIDNVIPSCCECNRIRSNKYSIEEMKLIGSVKQQIIQDRIKNQMSIVV